MNPDPKVSVLLPNLNTRKFLDERVDSIFKQTFKDWELVIVDNYSEDGAWEFFQEVASSDSRVRISQADRNGMYANWNNCIKQAKGEYIYIATSDDTMMPECLESMVAALEEYPQCDIAHCCLTIIDQDGNPLAVKWDQFDKVLFYGDFIKRMHIRKVPYDGYVHAGWSTVYTSITQLLIRQSLINKVGLFRNDLGSIADFEWEMRAALVSDVIHVPKYLATWRKYPSQATRDAYFETAEFSKKLVEMVESAFQEARRLKKDFSDKDLRSLQHIYKRQVISRSWNESSSSTGKLRILFQYLIRYPEEAFEIMVNKLSMNRLYKPDVAKYIHSLLKDRQLENNIFPV